MISVNYSQFKDVQVFTGDFNDFNKIIENSAIETYFQVFTGDFTD